MTQKDKVVGTLSSGSLTGFREEGEVPCPVVDEWFIATRLAVWVTLVRREQGMGFGPLVNAHPSLRDVSCAAPECSGGLITFLWEKEEHSFAGRLSVGCLMFLLGQLGR